MTIHNRKATHQDDHLRIKIHNVAFTATFDQSIKENGKSSRFGERDPKKKVEQQFSKIASAKVSTNNNEMIYDHLKLRSRNEGAMTF